MLHFTKGVTRWARPYDIEVSYASRFVIPVQHIATNSRVGSIQTDYLVSQRAGYLAYGCFSAEISFLVRQSQLKGRYGVGVPRLAAASRMKFSNKCCADAWSVPSPLTRAPGRHVPGLTQ